jgi:hypothetical protein
MDANTGHNVLNYFFARVIRSYPYSSLAVRLLMPRFVSPYPRKVAGSN